MFRTVLLEAAEIASLGSFLTMIAFVAKACGA